MTKKRLKEDVFHYIWKTKSFNTLNLKTLSNEIVECLDYGTHNHDAGPDFLNARIKIDEQIWIGHVEIHVYSSDWYAHKHQNDPAYNSVILHVSYIHDKDIRNEHGQLVPAIELKDKISVDYLAHIAKLKRPFQFVACESLISSVDASYLNVYFEQLIVERLIHKTNHLKQIHGECAHNWIQTCFVLFARSFGGSVNKDAFERLAFVCNYAMLSRYREDPLKVYALIFGQAGFLFENGSNYVEELFHTYTFLKKKHTLIPMDKNNWKYSRMRPNSFPDLRMAFLAESIIKVDNFQSLCIYADSAEIDQMLNISLDSFWDDHYRLDRIAKRKIPKRMTISLRDSIKINALIPLRFFYSQKNSNNNLPASMLDVLRSVKAEQNKVTKSWMELGIDNSNALDSQASLHLFQNYCKLGRCLHCKVGHYIIQKNTNS